MEWIPVFFMIGLEKRQNAERCGSRPEMNETKIHGIMGEGRALCLTCAERVYGSSLKLYLSSGEILGIRDTDAETYTEEGLICEECFAWIFQPAQTKNSWWVNEPDPEEHLRLLLPFADFLETLQVDAVNLRQITV